MCRKIIAAGFIFLIIVNGLCAVENERPATRRFGIFIGSNNGGRDRVMLRYAVSDAKSVSRVFVGMGGIADGDNLLLVEPTVREINRQLDNVGRVSAQSRRNGQRTELVFYYSGHSDENGIFLNRERYGYRELRERINTVQADMRVVILDSCSSGAMTRAKGGEKTQPFLFDTSISAEGYAFLTSSSADEASQESDSIESSYFTHSLLAGLRGAADSVGDGRVTLNELYRYAYTETLAKTETSVYGTQHPSYDIQISGSGDVVLTDIKEISASLLFSGDISGRISIRDSSDFLVAELTKVTNKPLELGLEPGEYRITLQQGDNFYRATITLPENQRTTLGMGNFQVIAASVAANRNRGDNAPSEEGSPSDEGGIYPVNLQIIPGFNMLGLNGRTTNNVLIGLFGGIGYNIRGVGVGTFGLINTGDVTGIQGSGIFNFAGGNIRGLQASAIGNMIVGDVVGVQGSGIFNFSGGNVRGLQGSAIANYAGEINGAQVGMVNINRGGKGAMVGLVNISQSEDIIPIGLVNIMKNGILAPAVYVDDMLFTNISLRSGTKHFYGIFSYGVGGQLLYNRADDIFATTRAGIGYEYRINKIFLNIDFTIGSISTITEITITETDGEYGVESNPFSNIYQLRLTGGYTFFKHLSVFGGISYDILHSPENNPLHPRDFGGLMLGGATAHTAHKFGFFGGVQF